MADISKIKLPNNIEYNIKDPISYNKIISRGEQLVVNGSGLLGDNTNFSSWVFDGCKANGSSGSFTRTSTAYANIDTNEFFPVNPSSNYLVSLDMVSSNGLATAYLYLSMFDADKISISTSDRMWRPNTLTSLTQDLKNGDTVVHLADLTNWDVNTATKTYQRGFIFWNYKNSFGFQYPENTYSKNHWSNLYPDANVNKTSKTITLSSSWNHGTIPAGTKVSQSDSGGTYMYLAIRGSVVPSTWTKYTQYISGVDNTGRETTGKFWAGTAYAKIGFLWNHNSANDQLWATNISMKEVVGYTFANGTNGFTVTPSGGTAQTVTVTPSITNNITGSGASGNITKFNGANTVTSASASDIVSALGTTAVNRATSDASGNTITSYYAPKSTTVTNVALATNKITKTINGSTTDVVTAATTSTYGITKLSTSTSSTATDLAATPSAVKTAYDLANTANGTANTALSGVNGNLIYDHTFTISNGVATFTPHVYQKGAEVTTNYAASCFGWKYRLINGSEVTLTTKSDRGCDVTISNMGYGGHVIGAFTPT